MTARLYAVAGAILVVLTLLTAAVLVDDSEAMTDADSSARVANAPVVVAAGDIACEPGLPPAPSSRTCQQAATARLAASFDPTAVLALGDTQYETGALEDYVASYSHSWGALLPITRPGPGCHEYETAGAAGYYCYFKTQKPGPAAYYAFYFGTWRLTVEGSTAAASASSAARCGPSRTSW